MNKLLLAVSVAAALGVPAIAGAQTTSTAPTIACRATEANETPTTTIGGTAFICRTIDMAKIRTAMAAVMNDNLTPDQKAKLQFAMSVLQAEMQLHPRYPGYNGDTED